MSEFNNYLKNIKNNSEITHSQKIHAFNQLCKKYNIEPIILRLSGEIKNKLKSTSYLITFTTTRVIVSKKGNLKSLFDIGYIAGLGPYLYYLVSDKIKNLDEIKLKNSLIKNITFNSISINEYYIEYNDINKIVFYNGVETRITNMFGSAVSDNFLKICTKEKQYNFIIPVKKNGDYEKILYWLRMSLPISIEKE
jgi:hypothetical protein